METDAEGYKIVARLTGEEYKQLEREMQWPEDLPEYDRLNKPINGYEVGSRI